MESRKIQFDRNHHNEESGLADDRIASILHSSSHSAPLQPWLVLQSFRSAQETTQGAGNVLYADRI